MIHGDLRQRRTLLRRVRLVGLVIAAVIAAFLVKPNWMKEDTAGGNVSTTRGGVLLGANCLSIVAHGSPLVWKTELQLEFEGRIETLDDSGDPIIRASGRYRFVSVSEPYRLELINVKTKERVWRTVDWGDQLPGVQEIEVQSITRMKWVENGTRLEWGEVARSRFISRFAAAETDTSYLRLGYDIVFSVGATLIPVLIGCVLLLVATSRRIWLKTLPWQCDDCGYDLRGNPTGGCPECGWRREAQHEAEAEA